MSDEVSKETKKEVKSIAEKFGKDPKSVKKDYLKNFNSPLLKKKDDREELALAMLKASYSAEFDRPTTEYQVYVLGKQDPRKVTRKKDNSILTIGNVLGLAVNPKETKKTVRFAEIGHFDANANKVEGVEIGKFYDVKLTGGVDENNKNALRLSATDVTSWDESDEDEAEGYDEPIEVLKKIFKKVDIAEANMKYDGKMYYTEGQVTSARIVPRKSGDGNLGIFKMVDQSINDDIELLEEMRGGMTIFVDETQVTCGYLSTIVALGNFTKNEEYDVPQMNGRLILPIIPTEFEPPIENVEPEDTGLGKDNEDSSILDDEDLD